MKEKEEKKENRALRLMRKTYGVFGLMEWKLRIPTGFSARPYADILFEGGQFTGLGIAPATFETVCPVTQQLIENSGWFADKVIRLLRERPYEAEEQKSSSDENRV